LALDIDVVIPGTGFPVTSPAELTAHRNKVRAVGERTRKVVHGGKSNDHIEQASGSANFPSSPSTSMDSMG
jgi:hypothetical protein